MLPYADSYRIAFVIRFHGQKGKRSYNILTFEATLECMRLNMERPCADTIGTVPVSWAGHFRCYIFF